MSRDREIEGEKAREKSQILILVFVEYFRFDSKIDKNGNENFPFQSHEINKMKKKWRKESRQMIKNWNLFQVMMWNWMTTTSWINSPIICDYVLIIHAEAWMALWGGGKLEKENPYQVDIIWNSIANRNFQSLSFWCFSSARRRRSKENAKKKGECDTKTKSNPF